jgi:hypothetical protein
MKFKLKDRVYIIELDMTGIVRRIQLEESGTLYEVRYFSNGEAHGVWFYEDELRDKK